MVWAVHIKKQVILMVWAVIGYLGLQTTSRTCPALFLPLEIEFSEELSYFQPVDKDTTQAVDSVNSKVFSSLHTWGWLKLLLLPIYLRFALLESPQKTILCIVEILE